MYYKGPKLEEVIFTQVEEKLRNLNGNKSSGPDGVHPRFLTEAAAYISKPLQIIIFTKSMNEVILPQDWKVWDITPLHKGSKKNAKKLSPDKPYVSGREDDGKYDTR